MLAVQRRNATLELLGRHDAVSVEALAATLGVSFSTVRRDLQDLERAGIVRRIHGGAVLSRPATLPDAPELPPAHRQVEHRAEKRSIARVAAGLIVPGSTVLITGGTTTGALVPLLASIPSVTVVTNSLAVATGLAGSDVDVVVLGGALRRPELSLLGHVVATSIVEVHVDHALMGVYGVDPRSGVLGASAAECETDRILARSARRLTILADASKFSRRSPHRIAGVELIVDLVTSSGAPPDDLTALRARGVDVHVA